MVTAQSQTRQKIVQTNGQMIMEQIIFHALIHLSGRPRLQNHHAQNPPGLYVKPVLEQTKTSVNQAMMTLTKMPVMIFHGQWKHALTIIAQNHLA